MRWWFQNICVVTAYCKWLCQHATLNPYKKLRENINLHKHQSPARGGLTARVVGARICEAGVGTRRPMRVGRVQEKKFFVRVT